jgi:hypothetical protein
MVISLHKSARQACATLNSCYISGITERLSLKMLLAQLAGAARPGRWKENAPTLDRNPAPSFFTLPSWCRPDTPTGHDRWRRWHKLQLKDKVPPDHRAYALTGTAAANEILVAEGLVSGDRLMTLYSAMEQRTTQRS